MTDLDEVLILPDSFVKNGIEAKVFYPSLQRLYASHRDYQIAPVQIQGGCSMTFLISLPRSIERHRIVQFRLPRYALSRDLALAAKRIYGQFVPIPLRFEEILCENGKAIQVCEMSLLEGVMFCDARERAWERDVLGEQQVKNLKGLMRDLARFVAMGWREAIGRERKRCTGKVGVSILDRLRKLEQDLPGSKLRQIARNSRQAVEQRGLDCLPVVLTHGDLLPSNILVDRVSLELKGLVDWAEAEYLPFGMGFYGIEHLLGMLSQNGEKFVYFRKADEIRDHFWACLNEEILEVRMGGMWEALQLARRVGILLWHGIAWDAGLINRVVSGDHDTEEVAYLEALLGMECTLSKF